MGLFVISDWWQASISHLSVMVGVPTAVVLVFLTSALRSSDACSCPPENNYYNDYGSMDYESWESLLFQQQINTSDIVALVEVLGESKRGKRDAEPYYDYYGDYETTTYGSDYGNGNWDSERIYSVKVSLIKVTGEIVCDKEFTTTFVTPYMDSMCGVSLEIDEKYLLTKSDKINNFQPEDTELPEMRVEHCPRHQFWRWSELSDEQKGLLPKQDCVKVNAAGPKEVCSTEAYSACAYESEYCTKSWWNGKMWCRGKQGAYRDCTDGEQCLSGECSEWQQCEP